MYSTQKEHLATMEDRLTRQMQMLEDFADSHLALVQRISQVENKQQTASHELSVVKDIAQRGLEASQKNNGILEVMAGSVAIMADAINGNANMKRKGLYEELMDIKGDVSGLKNARAIAAAIITLITTLALAFKDQVMQKLNG